MAIAPKSRSKTGAKTVVAAAPAAVAAAPTSKTKAKAKTPAVSKAAVADKPAAKAAAKPAVKAAPKATAKTAAKVAVKAPVANKAVAGKKTAQPVAASPAPVAKKAPSKKTAKVVEAAVAAAAALAPAPVKATKRPTKAAAELPVVAVAKPAKKVATKKVASKEVVVAETVLGKVQPKPVTKTGKATKASKSTKAIAAAPLPAEPLIPAKKADEKKSKTPTPSKTASKANHKPAPKTVANPATKPATKPVVAAPIQSVAPSAKRTKSPVAKTKPVATKPALVPAPRPTPPAPPAVPKPPAKFSLQRPGSAASGVFGDYVVAELAGEQQWRVSIRGTSLSDCRCTCEVFRFGERGSCEHVEFALGSLLDEPQQRAALEQGLRLDYSEVLLGFGAARYLRWRQGQHCPEAVAREAQALLDERGRLPADAADDVGLLTGLLQLAAELGHEVRVEAGVWEQVALGRDARQRVQRLAQAYPQGLESPALRGLLKLPLPLYQLEAALFAACAGRSLVADDLGLGLYAPAYAAAELCARHFGTERVLVLCSESAQARWLGEAQTLSLARAQMVWGDAQTRQAQLQNLGQGLEIKIASLASLGQDLALLQGFAPELIIVDEAARLDADALALLRQLDKGFLLMLSGQILDEQPQALLGLVDLLDRHRNGPWERFLSRHLRRSGQSNSFFALERLDHTLERVMFSRSRAELLPTLPVALVQLRAVALSQQQEQMQAPLLADLRRAVARWQRSGYVSESELLQVQQTLQQLRRLAISPQLLDAQLGSAEAPKLSAVAALTRELLGAAAERLVVFCQWDDALSLLAARLQASGTSFVQLHTEATLAQRMEALRRWRDGSGSAVLLCSDRAAAGLDLQMERAALVNLELPWGEALLEQRLLCLADEQSRGLPLIQLLAQTGFEQAMLQTLDGVVDLPAGSLDGDVSRQLLQGEEQGRFMQALVALCGALSN
ncbi:SNF2-related protein [Paucibacter sp. B2R-40]|uniref:SNF2-related protein n=1 Tax=Paucibacter sp. B2R-40 TaxID=2893554 RepID=UPI0021E45602|nr:SNF2-related protein [Paucibacter sp. B2R-40]MCV2354088.1 SNF2-related protein [Paucibacter sp. B2R-40]